MDYYLKNILQLQFLILQLQFLIVATFFSCMGYKMPYT
jgi:hypothetical protein